MAEYYECDWLRRKAVIDQTLLLLRAPGSPVTYDLRPVTWLNVTFDLHTFDLPPCDLSPLDLPSCDLCSASL